MLHQEAGRVIWQICQDFFVIFFCLGRRGNFVLSVFWDSVVLS